MRIHAIQTGSVAIKQSQVRGKGAAAQLRILLDREWTEPLPIYAWAIEHPEGVVLVDTGETARTAEPGYFPRWHPYYRLAVKAYVEPEQEIGPRLQALGISPGDVRWVVQTHLHTDHAGGLAHFRRAEILVSRREYAAASGFMGRLRGYLPNRWPAWFNPTLVDFGGPPFGPFAASHKLTRAGDLHLVPTPGHSPGHLSVILQEQDGMSLFFAGDTSYTQQLVLEQAVDGVAPDQAAARDTLAHINRYINQNPTVYLPSHDPGAAGRLRDRTSAILPRHV